MATSYAKPKVVPVVNLEIFGGQTNFDSDKGDFYGNGSWSLAPVIQFDSGAILIPSYSGLLRRTVQVQELVGGALLTQSQQDHNFILKSVHKIGESRWKFKPRIGYMISLLRETQDEGWGDGLFDYKKFVIGPEFELEGNRVRSFRTSLEYFTLRYPNFQSLSSQNFGEEINAGTDVLDLNALDSLSSWDISIWNRGFFSYSLLLSPRWYTDAKVINESGLFDGTDRFDFYYWNAVNLTHSFNGWKPEGINLKNRLAWYTAFTSNLSNQNDFDADQTQFNEDYYTYHEWEVGPRWSADFFKKWRSGLGYTYTQRRYTDRPVQSATGLYTESKTLTELHLYSFDLRYDLPKGFALNSSIAHQVAKSNNKYEQTFRYNYDSTHYFIGFSYAN